MFAFRGGIHPLLDSNQELVANDWETGNYDVMLTNGERAGERRDRESRERRETDRDRQTEERERERERETIQTGQETRHFTQ